MCGNKAHIRLKMKIGGTAGMAGEEVCCGAGFYPVTAGYGIAESGVLQPEAGSVPGSKCRVSVCRPVQQRHIAITG